MKQNLQMGRHVELIDLRSGRRAGWPERRKNENFIDTPWRS